MSPEPTLDPQPNLLDLLILLSFTEQPRHGYEVEIMVINQSYGQIHTARGTIYKALLRLCKEGHLKRLEGEGPRGQHYYDLTDAGWKRLNREISLLSHIASTYRHRGYGRH